MKTITIPGEKINIEAAEINIGNNVKFGTDINIKVRGVFSIGDNSIIGDRFKATAEELIIGDYFYNKPTDSGGMNIGGGGSNLPFARLKIGDRCVCHTGQINLARPVEIGNDVGLSHDVDLITHGFWYSVLQGYPAIFAGIKLGNNVILGWKSMVMAGVEIADNVVIGANATVVKSITESGIYGGTPAKLIRRIQEPTLQEKILIASNIIIEFKELMTFYDAESFIDLQYPNIRINELTIDVEKFTCTGKHDKVTDAFRDFLRRYGIRIYAPQGFLFNLDRK
jgi:acetyltransferase-like isoleucine patch superfamily enzyme